MSADIKRSAQRVQWLRRLASRRKDGTALVLSGGGPYGALQAGAIQALLDHGVRFDLVAGTSVGALNGAFVAADPTPEGAKRLKEMWLNVSEEQLFPGSRRRSSWARMLMRGDRIFHNEGLASVIDNHLPISSFEGAEVPLGVIATDLETGHDVTFSTGELCPPLLASAAMPGIYPPVEIEGRRYIDGGVANAVPIAPAVEMGAGRVYVVNCSGSRQERRPLHRPMDHLLHAFLLSRSSRFERDVKELEGRIEIIEVPVPSLGFAVPFTSMDHSELMLRIAYESASRFLQRVPAGLSYGAENVAPDA